MEKDYQGEVFKIVKDLEDNWYGDEFSKTLFSIIDRSLKGEDWQGINGVIKMFIFIYHPLVEKAQLVKYFEFPKTSELENIALLFKRFLQFQIDFRLYYFVELLRDAVIRTLEVNGEELENDAQHKDLFEQSVMKLKVLIVLIKDEMKKIENPELKRYMDDVVENL